MNRAENDRLTSVEHECVELRFKLIDAQKRVADLERDARIGKAVKAWLQGRRAPDDLSNLRKIGYEFALNDVRKIVARAEEER